MSLRPNHHLPLLETPKFDDDAFRRLPRLDTVSAPPVRGTHQGERLSRDQAAAIA